jgi:hypothetical protein
MTSLIFQSAWTNDACVGPPVLMMQFEDKKSSWSPMYARHRLNFDTDICGESPLRMASGCCISAIRPEENQNYGSTTHAISSGTNAIPKSAIGGTYCHYTSKSTRPLLYTEMHILDDGNCYGGSFQCMNHTLWIYNPSAQGNCVGNPMTIILNDTAQTISTPIGLISAKSVTIQDGNVAIGWTTYFPSNLLTPESSHISYPLGIAFTFMAILGTLLVGTFYSYRY